MQGFFIRNHFISNLVLNCLKFKNLLELQRTELRNIRQIARLYQNNIYQRNFVPEQCRYNIALEFNSDCSILFVIRQTVCCISGLCTLSLQLIR